MDKLHQFAKAPLSLANAHSFSARTIEAHCKAMEIRTEDDKQLKVGMLISSVVLRALALELYIKSLCFCIDAKPRKGHKLGELFGEISDTNVRADIERQFKSEVGRDVNEFLTEIDDAFVFWRYVHEALGEGQEKTCDTDQMDNLSRILCEKVNALFNLKP